MPGRYRERPYVPARDPLTAIPPSRHPFQFWVLFALVVTGLSNFFTPGSEVLQQGLNPVMHKTWAATLAASGLIALISAWWPDRVTGLLLERSGLITVGITCPPYAVIVWLQLDEAAGPSIPGITLTALAGVAAIWRAIHVTRELKMLRLFVARVR